MKFKKETKGIFILAEEALQSAIAIGFAESFEHRVRLSDLEDPSKEIAEIGWKNLYHNVSAPNSITFDYVGKKDVEFFKRKTTSLFERIFVNKVTYWNDIEVMKLLDDMNYIYWTVILKR